MQNMANVSTKRGRHSWGSPIAWLVSLNVIGVNLVAPILPAYAAHYGVGIGIASSLLTAFALARMSMRLISGKMSDKRGSRVICMAGGAIQAVGAVVASFAPVFWVLLAARLTQGIGSSMFGTAVNRHLLVITDKAELGKATAGFQSGILLGNTMGPLIGGLVADSFGIFAPFMVQAVITSGIVVASWRFIGDDMVEGASKEVIARPIRALLGLGGFKVVMVLAFGLFFVRAGATNVLVPAYADGVLALSPGQIGVIISLGSIVSLFVMAVAGRLSDSIGRRPVALAGVFISAVTVAAYSLANGTIEIAIVSALTGVGAGLAAVALPTMIGDMAPPGTEGLASGLYRMANDMGWIVGPTVLGIMADSSQFSIAFVVAGLPLLVGGLMFLPIPADRLGAPGRK
jgi:MFS transporter, DHA1 family, multidrug resistance protein